MGVFNEYLEVQKGGRGYHVYRSKPMPHYVLLGSFLLLVAYTYFFGSYRQLFGEHYQIMGWGLFLFFLAGLLVNLFETRRSYLAWLRDKRIIKKGSNGLSFSAPSEIWIEK